MGEPLLRIRGLRGGYGAGTVVDGVDLTLAEGECFSLVGPNGAGKSSLLRALSGALPRLEGVVEFAGEPVDGKPTHRIARLGIAHVPEGHGVFETMTVEENLRLGQFGSWRDPRTALQRRREALELFPQLEARIGQRASVLSGGERQMLALARALVARPRLLLIDEPSLGLAPAVVWQLSDAFRQLSAQGLTILIVEQSISLSLTVAERIGIFERGRIKSISTKSEAKDRGLLQATYFGLEPEGAKGERTR